MSILIVTEFTFGAKNGQHWFHGFLPLQITYDQTQKIKAYLNVQGSL